VREMLGVRCAWRSGVAARLAAHAAPSARALSCAAQAQQQPLLPRRCADERPAAAAAAARRAELPAELSASDVQALRAVIEAAVGPIDFEMMNRNARKPRRANHGAKPCSSVMRRAKRVKLRR
jgi:hypothetical protein